VAAVRPFGASSHRALRGGDDDTYEATPDHPFAGGRRRDPALGRDRARKREVGGSDLRTEDLSVRRLAYPCRPTPFSARSTHFPKIRARVATSDRWSCRAMRSSWTVT